MTTKRAGRCIACSVVEGGLHHRHCPEMRRNVVDAAVWAYVAERCRYSSPVERRHFLRSVEEMLVGASEPWREPFVSLIVSEVRRWHNQLLAGGVIWVSGR